MAKRKKSVKKISHIVKKKLISKRRVAHKCGNGPDKGDDHGFHFAKKLPSVMGVVSHKVVTNKCKSNSHDHCLGKKISGVMVYVSHKWDKKKNRGDDYGINSK